MMAISMLKFFEDFSVLTMAEWRQLSAAELHAEYDIDFTDVNATAREFAVASVSDDVVAVRYVWTLAGKVDMLDVHVFVFDADGNALERHYRVRALEMV